MTQGCWLQHSLEVAAPCPRVFRAASRPVSLVLDAPSGRCRDQGQHQRHAAGDAVHAECAALIGVGAVRSVGDVERGRSCGASKRPTTDEPL